MPLPKPGDELLGKYRVERKLGEGGFGVVYLATTKSTNRPVAVKVLKRTAEGTHLARFRREMQTIAQLQSPHTLTLYDYGELDGGEPFMVCEYVEGEDLTALLARRGKLSESETIHILYQAAMSFREAHNQGVLHRDIKPDNIRIYQRGDDPLGVKILDFGIARPDDPNTTRLTQTGNAVGTPRYMAPEQMFGEPLSAAADVFALGLVALEMLCGRQATAGQPAAVKPRTLPPDARVSPQLTKVVDRMLAGRVAERYPHAGAVLEDVRALRAGSLEALPAQPATQSREPLPSAPQSTGLSYKLIAGAAALVGVILLLVVFAAPTKEPATHETVPRINAALLTSEPDDPPVVPAAPDVGAADLGPPPTTAVCSEDSPTRGLVQLTKLDGLQTFQTTAYVPKSYQPGREHRVMLALHDVSQSAQELLDELSLAELAERERVVIVLPENTSLVYTWQDPQDTESVLQQLEVARDKLCLRPEISILGYGAGNFVVERLMCGHDGPSIDRIAAISYRRLLAAPECHGRAVPLIQLSPLLDGRQPINGGTGCLGGDAFTNLEAHEEFLRTRHQCGANKQSFKHANGTCLTHTCDTQLVTCQIDGGRAIRGRPRLSDCEGQAVDFPYQELVRKFLFGT